MQKNQIKGEDNHEQTFKISVFFRVRALRRLFFFGGNGLFARRRQNDLRLRFGRAACGSVARRRESGTGKERLYAENHRTGLDDAERRRGGRRLRRELFSASAVFKRVCGKNRAVRRLQSALRAVGRLLRQSRSGHAAFRRENVRDLQRFVQRGPRIFAACAKRRYR